MEGNIVNKWACVFLSSSSTIHSVCGLLGMMPGIIRFCDFLGLVTSEQAECLTKHPGVSYICRYLQHTHSIPIVGVEKRGA